MPTSTVRCPRGHAWDPAEFDDDAGPSDGPVACPYCGALCTMVAEPVPATKRATDPEPAPADEPRADFPGYQVLGVLGRGGMGVVYKARQIRTDRVVALKVPGHLDLETRVRFTTEAQAAARVSHPNIVQVYEVGEHQGRPFLALEYVPGGTLADRLTGAPLPARPAAALTEAVARAVGAAHAHGVVHRDLKPANILLSGVRSQEPGTRNGHPTPDPWLLTPKVADFGLARRLDVDTGQTRSGTILGTPDYMAPEQAAGDTKLVGPPADVWAVGAVLYLLLTGRPPFRGTGPLETLEQVRTLDPVSPRRLQPAVPRDVETICLKCLHKDPARRYPDATELADDLKRFLDGLPVRARPVGVMERLAKRARRNRLATGLAAGLCLVLVAAAAYGVWSYLRIQAERDQARKSLGVAVDAIEAWLTTEVSDDRLHLEPGAAPTRKDLLDKALGFYDDLRQLAPDDPGLAWLAAKGAVRVGDINRLLGRDAAALAAYEQAIDRLKPLRDRPPPDTDPDREIAYCHNFIGEVHRSKGDYDAADEEYGLAQADQWRLHKGKPGHPGYRHDLSRTRYNRGIVALRTGRPDTAVVELTTARQLLDGAPDEDVVQRRHRARIALNLGTALRAKGRLAEAEAECQEAIRLFDALVADFPERYDFQFEREAARINLGLVRWQARDLTRAKAELTRARDALAGLVRDFKDIPKYRAGLAGAYNGLAAVAFDGGARSDVIRFDALGAVAARVAALIEAADLSAKAAGEWAALIAKQGTADYHGERGISLCNQGRALYELKPVVAKNLLTQGLAEVLVGLKANPRDPAFRSTLEQQSRVLVALLVWAGDRDAAHDLARRIVAEVPDKAYATHRAVALLAACVQAVEVQQRPAAEADAYAGLAIELVRDADPTVRSALTGDPDCAPLLARADFAAAVGR